jgi:hypothetical protein
MLRETISSLEQENGSENENQSIINNIFSQVWGQETALSKDKICSKVLEQLLSISPCAILARFAKNLEGHVFETVTHMNGSHVFEAFVESVSKHYSPESNFQSTTSMISNLHKLCEVHTFAS